MELTREYRLSCNSLTGGSLLFSEGVYFYSLYQKGREYNNICDSGLFVSYTTDDPVVLERCRDYADFLFGLSFLELLAGAGLILLSRRLFDKRKIISF